MEHAVAQLALSTLSPVLSLLGTTVYQSYFGGDVTAEDMRKLQIQFLPIIQAVIKEAEYPLPLDHLRAWLDDLQAAVFEAEDLLDLYEYKKFENQFSSLPKFLKKGLGKTKESLGFMLPKSSLKICFEKLQKSAEEAEKLLLLIRSTPRTTMRQLESTRANTSTTSTVSTLPSPLFGREKECDIIIQFLLDESSFDSNRRTKKIPVTAIKGIGGSGKTSTAQGVYNDQRVVTHFNLRMWVHVSRSFDVHGLTKEIFESATKKKCPQISNLDALLVNLKEFISKHGKFLLVLDDIWCEDKMQWDQLLSPLNEVGEKGSRIIITTRMEKVTSNLLVENVFSLEELKPKDCWSILKHYAFHDSEEIIEDPELVNIGNQIINKVKYSPLALRVVGSLLGKRVSVNEWQKILKRNMLEKTMDALLLSFLYLPSHLQRCFAYCSLFPKGHKFHGSLKYFKDDLSFQSNEYDSIPIVSLWIAQGFVENTSESELTLEEKGNEYFEELQSYSFFEKVVHDNSIEWYGYVMSIECYVMHDLLHDLAEIVSKKHCHRIEDHGSLNIPATCIHLSVFGTKELENVETHIVSKMENLRTLIIMDDVGSAIIFKNEDIFKHLIKLRALHIVYRRALPILYSEQDVTFPNYTIIDRLKHLRYLHSPLKYYAKFPKSLGKLYHLQFFNTKDNGVNEMILLKKLCLLGGSHKIRDLEKVKSKAEAAEVMLNQKKNLHSLSLLWSSSTNITDEYSNTCEEVLDGLEPHSNLENLQVDGYGGVKAPNWMMKENWLPRLRLLYLTHCRRLKVVPYLPPCLNQLWVRNCYELVQLPPFGNTLKQLWLENCPKLMAPSMSNRHLSLNDINIRSCVGLGNQLFSDLLPFLTNLQNLKLWGFPNVQTLPNLSSTMETLAIFDFPKLTSIGNLLWCTSLKRIEITGCPMLTRDKSLLMEGDIARRLPCLEGIVTDDPLLVLAEQAFHSIEYLILYRCFNTLPNLERLSSLKRLRLEKCCSDLLPGLPISLDTIHIIKCPFMDLYYVEGGPLRNTISHIRSIEIEED